MKNLYPECASCIATHIKDCKYDPDYLMTSLSGSYTLLALGYSIHYLLHCGTLVEKNDFVMLARNVR